MSQVPSCPQRSEYEQFLLGKASAQEGERLLSHLQNCRTCNESIEHLLQADIVVEALRTHQIEFQPGQATVTVERLVKRRAGQAFGGSFPAPHEQTLAMPAADVRQVEVGQRTVGIETVGLYSFLSPPQKADELGRLAHYRILKLLGEGGMGMVFKAEDTQLERLVALKVMKTNVAGDPTFRERFLREAKVTAGLKNDHIVTIYQVGQERDVFFLAMEFLHGESLDARLKRGGKRALAQILRTAREIAVGLSAAHDKGLIHRDIKPANIWLETPPDAPLDDRNWGRAIILDFGLARQNNDDRFLTQSGMVVGTPAYMAPEQAQGEKTSARTDLFSLGSVIYHMCSGTLPFQGRTTMALLSSLVTAPARPLREVNPSVPEPVAELVMHLLSEKPEQRPASAKEVVQAIQAMEKTLAVTSRPAAVSGVRKADVEPIVPLPTAGREVERGEKTEVVVEKPAAKEPRKEKRVREAPPPPATKRRRPLLIAGVVGVVVLALVGWWLATVFLRVESDKGTLIVEIDDDDVEARFKNGKLILTGDKIRYELTPSERNKTIEWGDYEVRIEGADGLVPDKKTFTLRKGDKITVRVTMDPKAVVKTGDPDRKAAEYVLSVGGTLRVNDQDRDIAVASELPKEAFRVTRVTFEGRKQVSDAGLAAFSNCRSVAYLNLDDTPVSDTGLAHFKDCGNLTWLSLWKTKASDAGLAHFKDCKELRQLRLDGPSVSDAGTANFKDCRNLRVLYLPSTRVSDRGLAAFKDCGKLTHLGLDGTQISDAGLASFKDCTNLILLDLSRTQVGDAGLAHFKDCGKLTKLILQKTKVTAAKIEELKKTLPMCRIEWDGGVIEPTADLDPDRKAAEYVLSLGIPVQVNDKPQVFKAVADLPRETFRLTSVNFGDNKQVSDAGLVAFKDCRNLTRLSLFDTPVSDAGLAYFKDSTNLKFLSLTGPKVSDAGLAHFKDCRNLTELTLQGTKVSDAGLVHFKGCGNLTKLVLTSIPVSDAGLAHFKDCRNLMDLNLFGTSVTGAGLAHFKDCAGLTDLNLQGTKVNDAGLAHLRDYRSLANLNLFATTVGDAGLVHLKDCRKLANLNLGKTKVTPAKVEELKKALPKCRIEWDGGVIEPSDK